MALDSGTRIGPYEVGTSLGAGGISEGHDFVYGGLLIGDTGGRTELLANSERMDQRRSPHAEVVAFVRERSLNGRGRPQAVRNARSERKRRALTPPSTASEFSAMGE